MLWPQQAWYAPVTDASSMGTLGQPPGLTAGTRRQRWLEVTAGPVPESYVGLASPPNGTGNSVTPGISPSLSGNSISPSKPNQPKEKNPLKKKNKEGNTANEIS